MFRPNGASIGPTSIINDQSIGSNQMNETYQAIDTINISIDNADKRIIK